MTRIASGFSIYFRGMKLWATQRELLRLSAIPFFIDLVCLALGFYFTITRLPGVVAKIVHAPELWYQYVFYYLVLLITSLSLFFIVIFVVFIFANLLTFPFNDLLAERTLRILSAFPEGETNNGRLRSWLRKSVTNSSAMAKKTLILLIVGGVMMVSTLLPGLGFLAALVGVFLMAFDRVDSSFDHFQWPLRRRIDFVKEHFLEMIGFAGALGLTTAIPVINILVMSGSVVAGATLVAHLTKGESKLERSHP
jgi:uncharacterized protein involved in cysteine biosynthesis